MSVEGEEYDGEDGEVTDSWEGYESVQMFPGCGCGHDATDHIAAWGDWRDGEGCTVDGCPCEVEWEHA
jgi:hypothetical protein